MSQICQQATFHSVRNERGRHLGGLKATRNVSLLRDAIDGVAAKCCIFITDLSVFNLGWISPPSLDFFYAVPNLHGNALRGLPVKSSYPACGVSSRSSYRDEAASGSLDYRLSIRGVLFAVRVGISHIDF